LRSEQRQTLTLETFARETRRERPRARGDLGKSAAAEPITDGDVVRSAQLFEAL
jgi:hypothetical protein